MRKLLLIIVFFVVGTSTVNAFDNIDIDCREKNGNTECLLEGNTNFLVSAVQLSFEVNYLYTYESGDGWEGDIENNILLFYRETNIEDKFLIVKLIFDNQSITTDDIKIKELKYYDNDFNEHLINVNKANNKDVIKQLIIFCGIILLMIAYIILKKVKVVKT